MKRWVWGGLIQATVWGSILAACGGADQVGQESEVKQETFVPLDGVTLGSGVHDLRTADVRRRQRSTPHKIAADTREEELGQAIVRILNRKVNRCSLEFTGSDGTRTDGKFTFWLRPRIGGNVGLPWGFDTALGADPMAEAAWIASLIPGQILPDCQLRAYPLAEVLGDGDKHLDQLLPALNAKLAGCTLRTAGTVGDPDSEGNFRFYLEAVYPDRVDKKIHFETNTRNAVATDVEDFLKLIPSQAFKGCRHADTPPPPPPPPPPVDIQALRQHVRSILHFTNQRLQECVLYQEGDVTQPGVDGFGDFVANARYEDGSNDVRHTFRVSVGIPVEQAVQDMIGIIPSQVFQRCKLKGQDPGQPDAARPFVAAILKVVNEKFDNCLLAISGRTGVIDSHGDFDFYLTAYWKDDGSFLSPARFRANIHQKPDSAAEVLMQLVPAVEFRQCHLKP